jgi:hypothetical protein
MPMYESNKMETTDMNANGGVGFDQAATLALLADTNRAGRGGGVWGGGFGEGLGYGYGAFAGPTANAVRINRNADLNREQVRNTQFLLDQAEESRQFSNICQRMGDQEVRQSDRLRDLEREINQNARVAADCCCDIQKEILKTQALNDKCCCETQKEILRLDSANALRFAELSKQQAVDNGTTQARLSAIDAKLDANQKYNELFAENQSLKTQVACGCVTGCATPCPS